MDSSIANLTVITYCMITIMSRCTEFMWSEIVEYKRGGRTQLKC